MGGWEWGWGGRDRGSGVWTKRRARGANDHFLRCHRYSLVSDRAGGYDGTYSQCRSIKKKPYGLYRERHITAVLSVTDMLHGNMVIRCNINHQGTMMLT